jgi:nitrogen-specific signal transduction histidine kinase
MGKEQILQTVLNNIRDGVLFIDNSGRMNVFNAALAEMFSLSKDVTGRELFSFQENNDLYRAIMRTDKNYQGPSCWVSHQCTEATTCPEWGSHYCRCWIIRQYGSGARKYASCLDCPQYKEVRNFLEKPKELELAEKTISVLSSFVELRDINELWEVIIFRDVTADKLAAIKDLASATAHELRQPLQVIIGAVSLLMAEMPDNDEIKAYADAIEESCFRMDDIIEKIGKISKYKLKLYPDDIKIFDISKSSGKRESKT